MSHRINAYAKTHNKGLKGRALESEAFLKAARLLDQAQENPTNTRLLVEALSYTRNLWTIVQADLSDPKNKLDDELKSDLLSLSLFVDQKCREIIALLPMPSNLQPLIIVNRDIVAGLTIIPR